jgi:hypothetical protein
MYALQYMQLGKIPLNPISPSMLREMLKNIALAIPGAYDLIASLRPNKVFLYYEIIQAVVLADLHSLKLVLIFSLNTMNVQFSFYKVAVLPTRISNHTFVQFEIDRKFWN